jgi:hypothetical protein
LSTFFFLGGSSASDSRCTADVALSLPVNRHLTIGAYNFEGYERGDE